MEDKQLNRQKAIASGVSLDFYLPSIEKPQETPFPCSYRVPNRINRKADYPLPRKRRENLPRRKVTFDRLRRMRELRKEGLTYREIGRRLGIAKATVSLYLGERRKRGVLEGLRKLRRR